MNSTQNCENDKIPSWKSDSSEVRLTESESENPRLTEGETRYCIFDKYKLIFVSLGIFSMGERRRSSIIGEPCLIRTCRYSETSDPSPSIACRFQRFFSAVTLDFSALAIRVANALRKLRYHQLCSPASLPTEWTQSGSLSSESSFRWFLPYVRTHSLTDRKTAH